MVKKLLKDLEYDNLSIEKIIDWYSDSLEYTLYDYIINTFKYLGLKGYSEKDVIKMTKQLPTLFGYGEQNIEDKFKYLNGKGYSKKDIVKMTKQLPSLFSLSKENIDKKIEFYKEINLEFIIINDTMKLMQSIELTNARYNFFTDLGIIINQDSYRKLFYGQKQFGITNKELLERYPYNKKEKVK